jgi:hypothetical protein
MRLLGGPEHPGQRQRPAAMPQRRRQRAHHIAAPAFVDDQPDPLVGTQPLQHPAHNPPVHRRRRPQLGIIHNAAQSAFVTGRLGGAQRDVGLGRGDPPQDDRPGQQDADHEQRQPLAGGARQRVVAGAQQRLDSIGQVRYAGHESGSFCDNWWYIYHRRFQAHGHVRPGPRPQALIRSVRP